MSCQHFGKMASRFTCVVLLCMLVHVYSICFEERSARVLSCYDEDIYEPFVAVEVLYLHDSYISELTLSKNFPNIQLVFVEGRFGKATCREIADIVDTVGCVGKYFFCFQFLHALIYFIYPDYEPAAKADYDYDQTTVSVFKENTESEGSESDDSEKTVVISITVPLSLAIVVALVLLAYKLVVKRRIVASCQERVQDCEMQTTAPLRVAISPVPPSPTDSESDISEITQIKQRIINPVHKSHPPIRPPPPRRTFLRRPWQKQATAENTSPPARLNPPEERNILKGGRL